MAQVVKLNVVRMKSATKKIKWLLPLLLIGGMFTACQDRGDEPQSQEQMQEEQPIAPTNLDTDVVEQVYDGEVAVLGSSSADFMPYFLKRFPNTAGSISENTAVVVLDETAAQGVLGNASLLAEVQSHWAKNKAIGFINPSENAIQLLAKLNGAENATIEPEAKLSIENYAFYLVRKDGNAMSYCKMLQEELEVAFYDSTTNQVQSEKLIPNKLEITAYEKGRIGERAAEWLNTIENQAQQRSLLASSAEDLSYHAFTQKIYYTINVKHDEFIKHFDYDIDSSCGTSSTEAVVELTVYAGYDQLAKKDVYDVVISETFDAKKTYIENKVFCKKAAYKYKYTGGNYQGAKIGLKLSNVSAGDISFSQPVPVGTAGSYSSTHTPASFSVGCGLAAGVSPSGPSVTGNFSFTYTPPKTTVSLPHSDLPLQFNDNHSWSEWEYGISNLDNYPFIYETDWGFNADYVGTLEFSTKACKTEQAVTFMVANTENRGSSAITLCIDTRFGTYHEVGSPFTWARGYRYYYNKSFVNLPQVNRFFDRYTPDCYDSSDKADTQSWNNLETLLKDNVKYKQFYNKDLEVGAVSEALLPTVADSIWADAIKSLITQYNGRDTHQEYVIGLANLNGVHLSRGLHIKDGKWQMVDDIRTVYVEKQ